MPLTPNGYALLGLTALVACLVSVLTFAVLRMAFAIRSTHRHAQTGAGAEMAIMSAALQDAVAKLKAQERATAARADASERLSDEIIASLSAGLLVVGLKGEVRIINPAGRRMLNVAESAPLEDHRRLLGEPTLSQFIDECITTKMAIARRT